VTKKIFYLDLLHGISTSELGLLLSLLGLGSGRSGSRGGLLVVLLLSLLALSSLGRLIGFGLLRLGLSGWLLSLGLGRSLLFLLGFFRHPNFLFSRLSPSKKSSRSIPFFYVFLGVVSR